MIMDNVEGGVLECHPEFDTCFYRGPGYLKISIDSHQNKCPR